MAHAGLDNGSEKGRVFFVAVATLAAMAISTELVEQLGLWWIWGWINGQPSWTGLIAAMVIWGGVMLAFARGLTVLGFVFDTARSDGPGRLLALGGRGVAGAARAIAFGAVKIAAVIIAVFRAISAILEPFYIGFLMVAQPVLAPLAPIYAPFSARCRDISGRLRALWQAIVPPLRARAARLRQHCIREWTLRRAYRTEFREAFASYREFRRAFDAKSKSREERDQPKPPPAADPFPAACKVLGLPADGNFTEGEFKARYRALMKELHPDIAGPNTRAALVNSASVLIKKRKGWS